MTLTVLSDSTIIRLLSTLTRPELFSIITSLSTALTQYSANSPGYASTHQPQRIGITTPSGQRTLFMPFTSSTTVGTKIIGIPPPGPSTGSGLAGVVTLLDASGNATGLLNAAELTAFRTALASMLLYQARKRTGRIVIFGAGKQALWHIRLALLLRGAEIERVTVVNRSAKGAESLLKTLQEDGGKWEGVQFEALDPLLFGYWQRLEERVGEADVVFCCTPSVRPLFPGRFLEGSECYVAAIGSHSAEMVELDPKIFTGIVQSGFNSIGGEKEGEGGGGLIVVDSKRSCLLEAGEIIQGKIGEDALVDVGEIMGLEGEEKEKAREWLESGFLVYKCVGIAVMDAVVASDLVDLARSKGVGVSIPDF